MRTPTAARRATIACLARFIAIGAALLPAPRAATAPRQLLLGTCNTAYWSLGPGVRLAPGAFTAQNGEPRCRLALAPGLDDHYTLGEFNLPPSATELSVGLRIEGKEPLMVRSLFQDAHGWGGDGAITAFPAGERSYQSRLEKLAWSWRVAFFKSRVSPPLRFRGMRFSRTPYGPGGTPAVEVGPIRVAYEPDDAHWLYADVQPKTVAMRDRRLPALTVRLANLGTKVRSFRLTVRAIERNRRAETSRAVPFPAVRLEPGQQRNVSLRLPVNLLGRYVLEYRVAGDAAPTQRETIAVVNARGKADGFQRWSAHRAWFSAPSRRPATGAGGKPGIRVAFTSNGVSPVPLFPVQRRMHVAAAPASAGSGPSVITSMLSPAWLLTTSDRTVRLFGGAEAGGQGPPLHAAFASRGGAHVLASGAAASPRELAAMAEPWVLVWWQGSAGWTAWDMPFLVRLQHRPTGVALGPQGLTLTFARGAGQMAVMPLYGYAKLPVSAHTSVRLPRDWPADALHTERWAHGLPAAVAARCAWWCRALTLYPWDVTETYEVDHLHGRIAVRDRFRYMPLPTDWHTPAIRLAPLSPTLEVARRGGYPMHVTGALRDWRYPTLFGPYGGIENAEEVRYSLDIGPYLMAVSEPNAAASPDTSTPGRAAQASLLDEAREGSTDTENQMWDYQDENFVWYAQTSAIRYPAMLGALAPPGLSRDRKGWMQARTLFTLLDRARYKMDERQGTLTRRYIDGPGIGNWGSPYWGDSGKLGTDMIYDAWAYAYHTGDYQTIADNWDLITSLAVTPTDMSWLGIGRGNIAELGDEGPPMLALARLAYAVGDREEYAAAAYWYARELVHHVVKEGAFTAWREQFSPWHTGMERPAETATNLWGTNAAWVGGGLHTDLPGENQWGNFPVRFDDPDTLRFHRRHAIELARRVASAATEADSRGDQQGNGAADRKGGPFSRVIYWYRVAVLAKTPADVVAAQRAYQQGDRSIPLPDNLACRMAVAAREFPPSVNTLIPASGPPVPDHRGWAWDQMNNVSYGMVLPGEPPARGPLAPTLFWWPTPNGREGAKWSFGELWGVGTTGVRRISAQASVWALAGAAPGAADGGRGSPPRIDPAP